MKIKKLIKQVKWQVQECIDEHDLKRECFMNFASWENQQGVLLTPNEALQLIKEITDLTKFIKDHIEKDKRKFFDKQMEDLLLNLKDKNEKQ